MKRDDLSSLTSECEAPTASLINRTQGQVSSEDTSILSQFGAVAAGNIMEWYDFAVFGACVDIIGVNFFPPSESGTFVKSLLVYASAFIMRPVGGIIMGVIGDKFGSRRELEVSIIVMLIPTLVLAVLPTYSEIGLTATILLVTIRLMQGIAVGGELIGAFVYTIEITGGKHAGFWGACCKATGFIGNILGLLIVTLLRYNLSESAMTAFGWRLALLFGGVIGAVGIYTRSLLLKQGVLPPEPLSHRKMSSDETSDEQSAVTPLSLVFREYYRELILVFDAAALWGCGYYTCFVWLAYYMNRADLIGGEGIHDAWTVNLTMNILLFISFPVFGHLGDLLGTYFQCTSRDGSQRMLTTGAASMMILSVPAFSLLHTRSLPLVVLGQFLFVLALGTYGSNLPAFMVSSFPSALRCTGVGLGYNLANAIFAGTAPLVMTGLVTAGKDTNSNIPLPGVYLSVLSFVVLLVLIFYYPYCDQLRRKDNETHNTPDAKSETTLMSGCLTSI